MGLLPHIYLSFSLASSWGKTRWSWTLLFLFFFFWEHIRDCIFTPGFFLTFFWIWTWNLGCGKFGKCWYSPMHCSLDILSIHYIGSVEASILVHHLPWRYYVLATINDSLYHLPWRPPEARRSDPTSQHPGIHVPLCIWDNFPGPPKNTVHVDGEERRRTVNSEFKRASDTSMHGMVRG